MIYFEPNLKIFTSSLINDNIFFAGFGTRQIGDGRKISSIINFFQTNKIPIKKIVFPEQIHSLNTVFFSSSQPNLVEYLNETDGIITQEKNTALVVITADCQPIVYVDKKNQIIAISHQGWRGSIKRLPQKMVTEMIKYGAKKEEIVVALGPAIGVCCYHIDEDRYYQFLEEFDGYSDKIFVRRGATYYLNLSYLNFLQLQEIGINKNQIDYFPFCTACDKKRFFSLRREGKKLNGEMINFIAMLKP